MGFDQFNGTSGKILTQVGKLLQDPNMFGTLTDIVGQVVLNPLGVIQSIPAVLQAGYESFNTYVQNNGGIAATFEKVATQVLKQGTIEKILGQGSMGAVLAGAARIAVTLSDGTEATEIVIDENTSIFTDADENYLGKKEGGITEYGEYLYDEESRSFGMVNGTITGMFGVGTAFGATIANGGVGNISLNNTNGVGDVNIRPTFTDGDTIPQDFKLPTTKSPTQPKSGFNWTNFIVDFVDYGIELAFTPGGVIEDVVIKAVTEEAPLTTADLDRDLYVLVNGILNNRHFIAPNYLYNYQSDIVEKSEELQQQVKVLEDDIVLAPTYFKSKIITVIESISGIKTLAKALTKKVSAASFILGEIMDVLVDPLNLPKDLALLMAEAVDAGKLSLLGNQIKSKLDLFFDTEGDIHRERQTVAVGYSGGFLPLAEVMASNAFDAGDNPSQYTGYNLAGLVGLGAANFKFNDLVHELVDGFNYVNDLLHKVTQSVWANGHSTSFLVEQAKKLLYGAEESNFITGVVHPLLNKTVPLSFDELVVFREFFKEKMADLLGYAVDTAVGDVSELDLTQTEASVVVNVYGSKDFMLKDGFLPGVQLGGPRTDIGGYTVGDDRRKLINIEITGASHSDYIRDDETWWDIASAWIFDSINSAADLAKSFFTEEQKAWKERVSDFVTELTLNSQSQERVDAFLTQKQEQGLAAPVGNKWVITLEGAPTDEV